MLRRMKSPEQPMVLPLEYATELTMELLLMRGECCDAANALMQEQPLDEDGLEECAVLDEALARAQVLLHGAVANIRKLRASRGRSPE